MAKAGPDLFLAFSRGYVCNSSACLVSYTAWWVIDQETCKRVLAWHNGNLSFPSWTLHWGPLGHSCHGWILSSKPQYAPQTPHSRVKQLYLDIGKIHTAGSSNFISAISHYTLNLLLQESELASPPLKKKCPCILRECLQDTETKSCVRYPAGRKQKGGKEKDKSK